MRSIDRTVCECVCSSHFKTPVENGQYKQHSIPRKFIQLETDGLSSRTQK